MNYSTAIFLISDEIRAIEVLYDPGQKSNTSVCKTLDPRIQVDDYVVVETVGRHGMTVVQVIDVDLDLDVETEDKIRWVVGAIDMVAYEQLRSQEDEAIAKIKGAEKRRKRKQLRESLIADAADDLKALPIATAAQEPPVGGERAERPKD